MSPLLPIQQAIFPIPKKNRQNIIDHVVQDAAELGVESKYCKLEELGGNLKGHLSLEITGPKSLYYPKGLIIWANGVNGQQDFGDGFGAIWCAHTHLNLEELNNNGIYWIYLLHGWSLELGAIEDRLIGTSNKNRTQYRRLLKTGMLRQHTFSSSHYAEARKNEGFIYLSTKRNWEAVLTGAPLKPYKAEKCSTSRVS